MSSQYIPFHVHSDTYVPVEVVNQAISKVWSFLNRKKALMGEKPLKERKAYLSRQRNRLFSNLREECRPSTEEAQFYVAYNESLPFGGGHLTLQDAFRRLAAAANLRDEETGAVLDAAIVTAIVERVRSVLHNPKIRVKTKVEYEVAPLTSDKNPHRWNASALFFTHLSRLEAASDLFAKSTDEEIDKWTKVQVADVSLDPPPAPIPAPVIPAMTAQEAIARVRETELQLQALKEARAQLQIDAAITMPVTPASNGARDQQLDRRAEDAAGING